MHSIFKIGISRNMKCAYMVGFLKYGHIYVCIDLLLGQTIFINIFICT